MSRNRDSGFESSVLLMRLFNRYLAISSRMTGSCAAGDLSEVAPEEEQRSHYAYVFEPRLCVRGVRDIRALLLYIVQQDKRTWSCLVPFLLHYQELNWKRKEPAYQAINLAIQFIVDGRFDPSSPIRDAVEGILNYQVRSYLGNDLHRAENVLRFSNLKLRALQHSKAIRSSLKRPKERSSPVHTWLPNWKAQYQPEESHFEEPEDPIWELLSPSEVASHFLRQ